MAKKPEDYFNELAKVKPSPTGLKPIAYREPKKGGPPMGLILLVVGGIVLYSFVHYFTTHDPTDAITSVINELPASAKTKVKEELTSHRLLNLPQTTGSTQPASSAAGSPRAVAAANAVDSQFVQIDGKWYKKNPSNVYMVNGHAVFYVDDHRVSVPAPAQATRK